MRIGSLFSGVGGLELGLEWSGLVGITKLRSATEPAVGAGCRRSSLAPPHLHHCHFTQRQGQTAGAPPTRTEKDRLGGGAALRPGLSNG